MPLVGMGAIRACDHALGSIPMCLASATSHSALVNLGLCTVNTPLRCHDTINTSLLGTTAQVISVYNSPNLKTEPLYSVYKVCHVKTPSNCYAICA